MQTLNVHFLPAEVEASALAGSVVVVIDLLRASSTICQALASGALCVMPFVDVEEALRAAAMYPRGDVVLGGERHGRIIDGFDVGNSPLEYVPAVVAQRRVLFTTTNGTRALDHAQLAKRTLVGCALNRRAIAEEIAGEPWIDILCAGTDGEITGEDILAAGAIVYAMVADERRGQAGQRTEFQLNERGESALAHWEALLQSASDAGRAVPVQLAEAMRDTPGGRNLLAIGHDRDLEACARLDALELVPELHRDANEIRPA